MIHWVNRSMARCCSGSGRPSRWIEKRAPFSVEKAFFFALPCLRKGGRWKLNGNSVIPQKYELLRRRCSLRPSGTMGEDAPLALLSKSTSASIDSRGQLLGKPPANTINEWATMKIWFPDKRHPIQSRFLKLLLLLLFILFHCCADANNGIMTIYRRHQRHVMYFYLPELNGRGMN